MGSRKTDENGCRACLMRSRLTGSLSAATFEDALVAQTGHKNGMFFSVPCEHFVAVLAPITIAGSGRDSRSTLPDRSQGLSGVPEVAARFGLEPSPLEAKSPDFDYIFP